ncbi:LOW QUALITY PROTEIN: nuclear localized protein 1 [Tachypleus tridentatus]|uniref:LOW QUALITY PROTEIN: nuclear localized protein 1 n=1 Tax=Tachypleus tridentatus TaxID=6853 RepID=UPI003FCF6F8F
MSNRVLKKLQGEKDLASTIGIDGLTDSDDASASQATAEGGARSKRQRPTNRFELLNSVEHSLSDTEAKEDDDRENEPSGDQERNKLEKQDSTQSTDSLKRKKKKKKKKMKNQKSTEDNLDDAEDEIDASIREVNKILGEPEQSAITCLVSGEKSPHEKSILSVDYRNLNPENELRKIFGSKVIQAEQVKRRGRGRSHSRASVLVIPRNWPHVGKPGISMTLVETKGDIQFFTFEHSKQYQTVQFQFLDAVESFNPDNIVSLLNMHPYHVDALIQFSDICKMGEDLQMAAELIERALYCMECCFHPLFNVALGNCRLDYRRAENRSFFIALFKHMNFVGQRGCSRTALEFCKVLLGLDPDGDPLGVTLIVDFYAIRSEQYIFLIKMYHEWDSVRNLSQLPNFSFSVSLATFLQAIQEGGSTKEADELLQKALIMFPSVLIILLDKCSVTPDEKVAKHPFFSSQGNQSQSPGLQQLVSLYVGRCHGLWKSPEVMEWLERNVNEVIHRVESKDPFVKDCKEKRSVRYQGTPRNILRHIILSGIKEATVTLPQELTQTPIFGFDPLPPKDAITNYSRPPRSQPTDNHGVLSMFFRSLLPNYHLLPADGAHGERNVAGNQEEAAEGEHRGTDTNDLRRSVTSLLDAMRDLLSNIHLADVPNEGDVESDDEPDE